MTHANPTFRPCLVLPTYNNACTLASVVERAATLGLPVYVVDDGSTDQTAEVLEQLRRANCVALLRHERNRGKAAAMHTGFEQATLEGCSHALTIDTDGQLDPAEAPLLLEAAERNPRALVLGVRRRDITGYPPANLLGRRLSNLMLRLECGLWVGDSQCGMRVYPLELLRFIDVAAGRYGFETEVITKARWAGADVVEVPVSCRYFQGSERVTHFRPVLDTVRAAWLHAKLLGRRCLPVGHPRWDDQECEGRVEAGLAAAK